MGQVSFTSKQKIIFDEFKKSVFLRNNFYFTGGTALSAIYLHHRLSDDLDFFSQNKFDTQPLLALISEWGEKYKLKTESKELEVVRIYLLKFPDGEKLKVDFGYYPYKRLETGKTVSSVEIDSLLDIAVNKLQTIHQRTTAKDFVDLYFLLKKFTIWDLMEGVRVKFRIELDPYTIAADCLKVDGFENLPVMLKPLTLTNLQIFYRDLAKKIGLSVVEK